MMGFNYLEIVHPYKVVHNTSYFIEIDLAVLGIVAECLFLH